MLIWTGHGWLGALFVGLAFYGQYLLFGHSPDSAELELSSALLASLFSVVATALPCYVAGRWLNRGLPRKFMDYNADGSTTGHTLAFVRLEYAGLPVMLVVIALLWLHRYRII